jgi:hypothetical protein
MRNHQKPSLVRGYSFRIAGIGVISVSPWLNYFGELELSMYLVAAIGLALYIVGVAIKVQAEKHPETMYEELSTSMFWSTVFVFCCVMGFLLGSIYYAD